MEHSLRKLIEYVGPMPIFCAAGLLFTIALCTLFSLLFPVQYEKVKASTQSIQFKCWWLGYRLKGWADDTKEKANKSKRMPCDLCGKKYWFYHPTKDLEHTLNLCNNCKSNPEGWTTDWHPLMPNSHPNTGDSKLIN
jgi:hypothetical protein